MTAPPTTRTITVRELRAGMVVYLVHERQTEYEEEVSEYLAVSRVSSTAVEGWIKVYYEDETIDLLRPDEPVDVVLADYEF